MDFVVYAGVWSGGLFECGSRDDGTRGGAAPALVNIETWRDLSSGRPRAARILLAARIGLAKASYCHVLRNGVQREDLVQRWAAGPGLPQIMTIPARQRTSVVRADGRERR